MASWTVIIFLVNAFACWRFAIHTTVQACESNLSEFTIEISQCLTPHCFICLCAHDSLCAIPCHILSRPCNTPHATLCSSQYPRYSISTVSCLIPFSLRFQSNFRVVKLISRKFAIRGMLRSISSRKKDSRIDIQLMDQLKFDLREEAMFS